MAFPCSAASQRDFALAAEDSNAAAPAAKQSLLAQFQPLIESVANHVARSCPDSREDIHQAATLGLLIAIDRLDPAREAGLAAYAPRWVKGEARKAASSSVGYRNTTVTLPDWGLDAAAGADDPDLRRSEVHEIQVAVRAFLATLGPRSRYVIEQVFVVGRTQADVARTLGVSRARINAIIRDVCAKGRHTLAEFAPDSRAAA